MIRNNNNNPNGNTNMLAVDQLLFREKALTKDWASKFKTFRQNSQRVNNKKRKAVFFF